MRVKSKDIATKSDRDLIRGCRKGNTGAWKRLLGKYERLVFSIPLGYGLSREDAADITQITFTFLFQNLDDLREDSSLGAWLVTVARRHSWRLLDRNRRENEKVDAGLAESAALLGRNGAEAMENWELAEWITYGLSKIGEPCRELLLALYFDLEPASHAEIAARLDRPLGSIGPTRARCLKRLRQVLGDA